jgi:hypothetical protein
MSRSDPVRGSSQPTEDENPNARSKALPSEVSKPVTIEGVLIALRRVRINLLQRSLHVLCQASDRYENPGFSLKFRIPGRRGQLSSACPHGQADRPRTGADREEVSRD